MSTGCVFVTGGIGFIGAIAAITQLCSGALQIAHDAARGLHPRGLWLCLGSPGRLLLP